MSKYEQHDASGRPELRRREVPPSAIDPSPRTAGYNVAEISAEEFDALRTLIKQWCGIHLREGKQTLVRARLNRRLRVLGLDSFSAYVKHLREDESGQEITALLDAISTNVTSFFREANHFAYVREKLMPRWREEGESGRLRLRIWSAGCSSGEEPYSIAMSLREGLKGVEGFDARILATDISTDILAAARRGVYAAEMLEHAPEFCTRSYFDAVVAGDHAGSFRANEELRSMIKFGRLNLMDPWPMSGPFDAIFCRNVMIYFDPETQARLVARFAALLRPGGILFIGHSESLMGNDCGLANQGPAIYRKEPRA